MKKRFLISTFLFLVLFAQAQDWFPVGNGYFNSFSAWNLYADTANNNIYVGGIDTVVYSNNTWQNWYGSYGTLNQIDKPLIAYKNKKNIYFKFFLQDNDNSKPRTALVRFSNSIDLDTMLIMNGEWGNGGYTYYNNKLITTLEAISGSTVSYFGLAEFNDTIFKPIGSSSWIYPYTPGACATFNNELYAAGRFDSSIAVLKSGNWKTVYPGINGANRSITKLIVYHNRLYVLGGFWKAENPNNPGNSIAAWNGSSWDSLGGGANNEFVALNGGFDDAVVCDNKLYLVGDFTSVSGIKAKRLVSWNDTTWCTICTNVDSCQGRIWRIQCLKDTLYGFGSFNKINNQDIGSVAKLVNMNLNDTCSAPSFTGIGTRASSSGIRIYPNPVSNTLHIESEQYFETRTEIQITNTLGQIILKQSFTKEIDLTAFSPGYYTLRVVGPNISPIVSKFIKE